MPLAVKRYLACLAVISLLMTVYSAAMTPLLQSPEQATQTWQELTPTTKAEGWWRDLFPSDAWQNQNPMVIQTQQGTLLFQDISKTTNSDTMRLSPLTLIVPVSSAGREPVVGDLNASLRVYKESQLAVILAPEGAEIQFREAPDWASGAAPPVKEGKLLGPIQIFGINPKLRESESGAPSKSSVAWRIDTTTVRISGRHVWTNNDVTVHFGDNVAIGKDISIFLKQDLMGKRTGGTDGPWGLLDYMEIRTLKQVNISLPAGGLWKGMKLGPPELAAAHENLPARLLLTCKGIFQFDFDELEAKLSDNVLIDHRFENAQAADTFVCHELAAKFSEPMSGRPTSPNTVMVGPMKLDRIDAVAIDSVGPIATINRVKLDAPNIKASMDAKRIEVLLDDDAKGQCFSVNSLNGRSSQGSRQTMTPIALSYMGTTIHANELKYITEPNQLHPGWLEAAGPGDIETSEDSPVGRAAARWQTRLSMRPAQDQPMHVITLEGRALIEAYGRSSPQIATSSTGFLTSEQIDITLKPTGEQVVGQSAAMRVKRIDAAGVPKANAKGELVSAEVEMGNAAQNVRVKELHLNFVYPETSASAPANNALELTDAAGRPMRQWIGQPASAPAGIPNSNPVANSSQPPGAPGPVAPPSQPPLGLPLNIGSMPSSNAGNQTTTASSPYPQSAAPSSTPPAEPSTPLLILGKALYSDIFVGSPKPWIEKLVITGPVVISPKGHPQNDAPVWRIDGGQLQLNSDVHDHYRLQIAGGPARITFGDGWLEGPIVQLDQRSGHVWIENEGVLCVPASLMQARPNNAANNGNPQLLGQPGLQWVQPLKCYWKGDMLFNGLTANIMGNIEFREGIARTGPDRLLFIEGKCEALEVRMTEPINMGKPGKTTSTVHSLTLRDNVYIHTDQTDYNKNQISSEELLVPEVTYEVASNTIRGRGRGDIWSQHQSSGGGMGMLAGQAKPPTRTSQTPANTLQGMHLNFRDSMELLLTEKRLSFMGKVEVGLSPIQSFRQKINIDSMRVLQMDQSLLNGDLLRIYDASDVTHRPTATMADGAWEFAAQGNVAFESCSDNGELFGKASELTYIQAKDLLIIRGDTRIPAEIRLKPKNNNQGALGIFSLNQGSFNTKTFGQEGDIQITSVQWIPNGVPIPADWKKGNLAPAPGGAPAGNSQPAPRPRDGLQNMFKQK